MLAHNMEAKNGPNSPSTEEELGRHSFPHPGSCSIGYYFRKSTSHCTDRTMTFNLTDLSDLSPERCTCYFGHSICQTHSIPSLSFVPPPFQFLPDSALHLGWPQPAPLYPFEQKASQETQLCHREQGRKKDPGRRCHLHPLRLAT